MRRAVYMFLCLFLLLSLLGCPLLEKRQYRIEVESLPPEGGEVSGEGVYNHGQEATVYAAPNTGWDFVEWTEDGTGVSNDDIYSFTVTANRQLVANFVKKSYTLTIGVEGQGVVAKNPDKTEYLHGELVELLATPGTGWRFSYWSGDLEGSENPKSIVMDEFKEVIAHFVRREYSLIITIVGSGQVEEELVYSPEGYDYESIIRLTAIPDEGWEFSHWSGDLEGSENPGTVSIDSDKQIGAHFTPLQYTVTLSTNPSEGGEVSGEGVYNHGQEATVYAAPNTGWDFVEWTEDGTGVSNDDIYSFTVTANRQLVANFVKKSYNIAAFPEPSEGGTVTGGGTYEHGQTATVEAFPDDEWDFEGWFEGESKISNSVVYSFTVTSSRNLKAVFKISGESSRVFGRIRPYTGSMLSVSSLDSAYETHAESSDLATPEAVEGEYIIEVSQGFTMEDLETAIRSIAGPDNVEILKTLKNESESMQYILVRGSQKKATELGRSAAVSSVEPNYLFYTCSVPNDPMYLLQWHYPIIQLPHAWTITTGSELVVVAVVDTGVRFDHPDLQGVFYSTGWDFVEGDNDPTDWGNPANKNSPSHGTHVAGTIAALTNNHLGVSGVTWGGENGVRILPIRVLNSATGSGSSFDVASGIVYAVEHGAKVINLSLGSVNSSSIVHAACRYAYENQVVVVAAAGNDNSSLRYPARHPETISVGAIGPNKGRAPYSNFGSGLDVVAPGGDNTVLMPEGMILSTSWSINSGYGYWWMQGTSMAAPHVSGLVVLLMSQGYFGVENIRSLLHTTAEDLGIEGFDDYFGHGLVQSFSALSSGGHQKSFQVFLTDSVSGATVSYTVANETGYYDIGNDVPPGSYYLYAWVDVNGNGDVSAGDLFGFYGYEGGDLLTEEPELVTVSSGQSYQLDFKFGVVLDTSLRPLDIGTESSTSRNVRTH